MKRIIIHIQVLKCMHEKTTPCFWYGVNAVTVPWAKVGT